MTDTVETQLAVVISRLESLSASVESARSDIGGIRAAATPRSEWEQRNRFVDQTIQGIGREIGELRTELRARRTPWPTVLSLVFAGAALALALLPRLTAS